MNKKLDRQKVTVIESPVTERYCRKGDIGILDKDVNQIRVNGIWFTFDARWKVKTIRED